MDADGRSGSPGLLSVVRAHPILIAGCAALAGIVVFAAFQFRTPEYRARAEVYFRSTNVDSAVLNGASFFERQDDAGRQAATNLELIETPAIAQRVADALGGRVSRDELFDMMSFGQLGDSDIVGIFATHPDPRTAADSANTWAREFVEFRQETDRAQVDRAIVLIRDELAGLRDVAPTAETVARQRDLGANLSRLRVVQALQTGGAEFLEAAEPPRNPTGLRAPVAIAAGALIGLLIGLGGAYLATRSDRRVRSAEHMGELLGLPVLVQVPTASAKRGSRPPDPLRPGLPVGEAFKTLGVRLQFFNIDSDRRVLAVVSGNPDEGKTLVATHMASTSAAAGRRTLLIDCDLRRGDAALRFSTPGNVGLVQVLSGQVTLDEALQQITCESGIDEAPGGLDVEAGGLWLLPNGPVPPNAVQMLSSAHMAEVLTECRGRFDQVILDSAPLLRVSDSEPLLAAVDGFVVVTRLTRTTSDELRGLRRIIDAHRESALGVVVNDVSVRAGGNGYGYGYAPRPAPDRQSA